MKKANPMAVPAAAIQKNELLFRRSRNFRVLRCVREKFLFKRGDIEESPSEIAGQRGVELFTVGEGVEQRTKAGRAGGNQKSDQPFGFMVKDVDLRARRVIHQRD
jgi:hypothetical protein